MSVLEVSPPANIRGASSIQESALACKSAFLNAGFSTFDLLSSILDLGDGLAHVVKVLLIERRHADAAAADEIDAVIASQPIHGLPRQPRVREHPALALDEAEVPLDAFLAHPADKQLTHPANALAHLGEFALPAGAHFGVGEH